MKSPFAPDHIKVHALVYDRGAFPYVSRKREEGLKERNGASVKTFLSFLASDSYAL